MQLSPASIVVGHNAGGRLCHWPAQMHNIGGMCWRVPYVARQHCAFAKSTIPFKSVKRCQIKKL
jgi:hypothetical protein